MATDVETVSVSVVQRRWVTLVEVIVGAFIVIGHNVFHVVPNEVPILFVLFWISPRLLRGKWDFSQLRRPASWWRTIAMAVAATAVLLLGSEFVVQPMAARFWPEPEHVSSVMTSAAMGWKSAALSLLLVWTFAAFGEELSYRGYLLKRAAELGGGSRMAWTLAMLYVCVLFGVGHFYKGSAGMVDSAWSGLVLGAAFLLSGCNLWAPILAHGLTDTVVVVATFMGWAN
jgi:hypothetical protein